MPDLTLIFQEVFPLLVSSDREVRMMAIAALGRSGDGRAVELLFRACMDEDDLVKHAAYEALAALAAKSR
jgi:HEAT repeat protein